MVTVKQMTEEDLEENPKEIFEGFAQYSGEPSKLKGLKSWRPIRGRQTCTQKDLFITTSSGTAVQLQLTQSCWDQTPSYKDNRKYIWTLTGCWSAAGQRASFHSLYPGTSQLH